MGDRVYYQIKLKDILLKKLEVLLVNQEFMNLPWGVNNQKHYLNEVEVNTVDDPYNLLKKYYILKKLEE